MQQPAARGQKSRRTPARRVSESTPPASLWRADRSPAREDAILLDTHAWIWTLDGSSRGAMAAAAVDLIDRAAADGRLYVSDISFWEVSLKASSGKLVLSIAPTLWLSQAARAPGIRTLPLSREVLLQSTLLPGTPRGDPADRMLIAQAQLGGMSLLTCDGEIIDYAARQRGIPVCDARRRTRRRR